MSYHVLIADDMLINRKLMKAVLKDLENTTFYDAEDGVEAIETVFNQEIDLIILDLMMPIKDGFEVLRKIKSHEKYQDIPVIIYTALDKLDHFTRTLELGAYDYLTKPLSVEQMKAILPLKVKNALKSYEQKKILLQLNRQMEEEMRIANIFQNSLIAEKKEYSKASMVGKYLPSLQIGGDFYDFVQVGDDIWFIIADVVGHGVAAAMISSMIKVEFNNCIRNFTSPEEVLAHMNQTFYHIMDMDNFCTAFVGVIRSNTLYYSNAGHPYPLVFNFREQRVETLKQNGFLVGAFLDACYYREQMDLYRGDKILLFTDGLIDKYERAGEDYEGYLHGSIWNNRYLMEHDPKQFLDLITDACAMENHTGLQDDVAVMLITIN